MGSSRTKGTQNKRKKKYDPNKYKKLDEFKEAEPGFYTEVQEKLEEFLKNYNSRDKEKIKTHLETIVKALEKEIDGSLNLLFGGSVKKYTYVDGLSDIDMLVFLNNSDLNNKSPKEVLDYIKGRLEKRLPNSEVTIGDLAVTVKFKSSDIEIQLLPALKRKTGVKIASTKDNTWTKVVKPEKFVKNLTEVNKKNNGMVVPIIKLFKPINEKAPKQVKMSGYHIEALATDIFKDYSGPKTNPRMLLHFIRKAQIRVLKPIGEITGQSKYIDSKLGATNSQNRKKLSSYLGRVTRKMEHAISNSSVDELVRLFE